MLGSSRRKVLVTGAAGGMGRACARLFGMTHDLVLTDIAADPLGQFTAELTHDGFTIAASLPGELADDVLLSELVGHVAGEPFSLIHTAGLSPALSGWDTIMRVNLIATEKLLRCIEQVLEPGSAAVVIASTAGHMMSAIPAADALLREPLAEDFMIGISGVIDGIVAQGAVGTGPEGIAYMLSKRATLDLCARRAMPWGQRGARIVTISPGMILTPMGRTEMEKTPGAAQMAQIAPAGRAGVASDIALAAQFLASDRASYITGCDLLVDGGATAVIKSMAG